MNKLNKEKLKEKVELFVYDKKISEEILEASDFLEFEYIDGMIRPINYKLKFIELDFEIYIREMSEKDLFSYLNSPEKIEVDNLKEKEIKKLLEIEFYWKERISQAWKEHKQNHRLDEYKQ